MGFYARNSSAQGYTEAGVFTAVLLECHKYWKITTKLCPLIGEG